MSEGRDLVSDVQVHDSEESLLKLLEFSLPLVFFLGAVIQGFFQENKVAAEFELREHEAAQRPQCFLLIEGQLAGESIDNAERSEGIAVLVDKWSASIEADVRLRNNGGNISEALILERVRYDEDV